MSIKTAVDSYLGKAVGPGASLWSTMGVPVPLSSWSPQQFINAYGEVGWLFAAVSRISSAVGSLQWVLTRQRGGESRKVHDHILLDLLHDPNPFMTGSELLEDTQMFLDLVGDAFWILLRNQRGRILEIWPLMPTRMRVVPSATGFIAGYVYTINRQQIPFGVEDIIHFKLPNPANPYRGISPVASIILDLESEKFSAAWQRQFFLNSAQPGGVIEVENSMPEPEYERLKLQWSEGHQGISRAHKVAILEGGAKWKDMRLTQRDMQFPLLRKVNRDVILGAFGIPGSILGLSETVNRATAESDEFKFAKWVVAPRGLRISNKGNEQLAPQFDSSLILTFEDPVPEDKEFNLTSATEGFKGGYATRNEARRVVGLDPVANGDVFIVPNTVTQEPVITGRRTGRGLKEPDAQPVLHASEEEVRWKAFVDRLEPREKAMREMLQELFQQQEEDTLRNLTREERAVKTPTPDNPFDDAKWREETAKRGEPHIRETHRASAEDFALRFGFDFDGDDPQVLQWVGSRTATYSKDVTEATSHAITQTLQEATVNGEGIREQQARIRAVFQQADEVRAERIARTETVSASNQGLLDAAKQSGVVKGKRWLASMDERVRPTHAEANGQERDINEMFQVGADQMMVPAQGGLASENVNCRCTWTEILDVEARAVRSEARCQNCNKLLGKNINVGASMPCPRCSLINEVE